MGQSMYELIKQSYRGQVNCQHRCIILPSAFDFVADAAQAAGEIIEYCARACLKNHSRDLHSPLCGEFIPNLINVARYAS